MNFTEYLTEATLINPKLAAFHEEMMEHHSEKAHDHAEHADAAKKSGNSAVEAHHVEEMNHHLSEHSHHVHLHAVHIPRKRGQAEEFHTDKVGEHMNQIPSYGEPTNHVEHAHKEMMDHHESALDHISIN